MHAFSIDDIRLGRFLQI